MRRLRRVIVRVIVSVIALLAVAVAGNWVYERISQQRSLARQAAEIAVEP